MLKLKTEALAKIDEIVARHKDELGPTKLMLHDVQDELGYIPFEAMEKIADAVGTSVAEVYGVVTFYTQFTTEPKGKHVINVCLGTACYVKGSQNIIDKIQEITKAPVNGTSEDGIFSLDATRCLGACGLAPVVNIDGKFYKNCNDNDEIYEVINKMVAEG
ncbi:MAG: NAD(P)H-dependent oxidoreductase subunit E [Erysipelotrichaceae bacterium]|nr:NAD(P)H-dependent oxidoreductase subunit E [Erysipelotrichaceae bacterium]MBR2809065.1 NAD(P)H-dependent oxidoreductase subunit E [Erysipelotrichaceae bacterium]